VQYSEETMYVILGATGNTGSVVARKLLDKGKRVRVVGRDNQKLAPFVNRGADAFAADVLDTDALSRAFAGSIAKALEKGGVAHAVAVSSVGADKPDKTGPVAGLHKMELRLAQVRGLNALHLRAGYFMENTLAQIGIIRNFGTLAGPVRADVPLPMIATRDIGAAAAEALLRLDFKGQQTQELLGPRDVTYAEVATIIGAATGKPDLAYVQLPDEQVIEAMKGMGISRNMAQLVCEMSAAINSGYMKPLEPRSEKNTTSTTFETFVRELFLPAYRGQATNA
jgi:uncharacterized protein YbjT (DUF2867 family)